MDKIRIKPQKYMSMVAESLARRWNVSIDPQYSHVSYIEYKGGNAYTVITSDSGKVVAIGYNDNWTFSEEIVQ